MTAYYALQALGVAISAMLRLRSRPSHWGIYYYLRCRVRRIGEALLSVLGIGLRVSGGVALLWTSVVQANPVGEQVVAGAAGFERVGGALTITQGTDRAVINWNSFSIGAGEITKFVQPNSSSAVLNRVITANNPSAIYGTLQANGQVYLINPAGIFIGPGGLVDTAGFVASTHDVGDKEFMAGGDLNFTGSSGASIVNQGRIEAKQGDVFLVARQVSNEGQIMASDGTVGMISGTEVCLHSIGPNNYKVRLIDVANDAAVQKTGNGIADVVNAGVIEAANAELESTGNYLSLAIKNTGVIRATGVMANADGTVTLTGGEGDILNTGVVAALQKNTKGENIGGTIVASAKNITTDPGSIMTAAGSENGGEIRLAAKDTVYASGKVEAGSAAGKGGKVQVTGERVALIQAEVDVSGKTGGGTVLVGGDYLGKNPKVPNAKAVVMTSDSVIRANATENGDGGKVILWSDEYTGFYGEIFARGGIESGNGGFVETSSKDNLQAFGMVIASAVNGQGGLWLLDPSNVTISGATTDNGSFSGASPNVFTPTGNSAIANVTTINDSLSFGTSVTINAEVAGTQNGDITVNAAISKIGGIAATFTLNAGTTATSGGGNIVLNSAIIASGVTTGALNVELKAPQGSIALGNNAITTLGGKVTMTGALGITQGTGAITTTGGAITTTGGDVVYSNPLNLSGAAAIVTGGGQILFNAAVNGAQALTITAGTGNIRFGGDVGSTTTRLGVITVNSAGNVNFVKTVRASSLAQIAGTGTTTFTGAQNYNTLAGLNVVTDTISLQEAVTTTPGNTGAIVTLNANNNNPSAGSGTLTIGSTGDISADGVVNLTGASGIRTAGDVVTTADLINFNSPTILAGNIKVDTTDSPSSPGGANMVFQSTLDGAFTPTLTAGTAGNILFRGVIGGINSLDSLVMTAAGVSLFGVTTLNNQTYTTPLTLLSTTAASFVSTSGNINLSNGLESLSTTQALTISAANGTVTFGSSLGSISPFASVTVTGTSITTQSITTQGGDITLTGPVILSASSAFDATASGAVTAGGNITLTSTLNGTSANAENLSLTSGTSGNISIDGASGGTKALGDLSINAANAVTFKAVTASSVNQSFASAGLTQFAAITTTPTSAGAGGNVTLLSNLSGGQAINVLGAITTTGNSTGTISQSSGAVSITASWATGTVSLAAIDTSGGSGSIASNGAVGGAVTVNSVGTVAITGAVNTSGGTPLLVVGSGGNGGAVNISTSGATSTISLAAINTSGGTANLTGDGGDAGSLIVNTDSQTITLNGVISLLGGNSLTSGSGGDGAAFNLTDPTSLGGSVTITTTGGTATGAGTVGTDQSITFGSTLNGTAAGAQNLTMTAGAGNITFSQAVGGGTALGDVRINSAQTVLASLGFTAKSLTQAAGTGSTTFNGITTTGLANAVGGNVSLVTAGNISVSGGTVTTSGGTSTGVGRAAGSITLNSTGGTVSLGAVTATGSVAAVASALAGGAGGAVTVSSSGNTTLTGATINTAGGFGDGVGVQGAGGNGLFNNNVVLSGSQTITTGATAGDIAFNGTLNGTPAGVQNLTLTAGLGDITFGAAVGNGVALGDVTVTSAGTVSAASTFDANSFLQSAGSVATTFAGVIDLTTFFNFNGTALNINGTAVANSVGTTMVVNNAGVFTTAIGANLTVGNAFTQTGAGLNTLGGNIDSTNDGISFNSGVTLQNGITMRTGLGAGDNILFTSTLDGTAAGAQNLTMTAGTGSITFTQAVGGGTALGDVLINSAQTVLASLGFTAKSLTQAAGTGSTTFNGITTTGLANAVGGNVSLVTAGNISVSGGTVTTSGGTSTGVGRAAGSITLNSTGGTVSLGAVTATGSVAAVASALAGGAGGAVTVSSSGNTTLTGATINTAGGFGDGVGVQGAGGNGLFNNNVVLSGSQTITTGATAGDIAFNGTLNGTPAGVQNLTLTAGLGDITFGAAVGNGVALGDVTVTSAGTVSAASTFDANSFLQSAGSVATTFAGVIDLTTFFNFNGTALNINGAGANLVGTTMTLANAGLFTTADGANLTTDQAFSQTGAGSNLLGGNITANTGGINFSKQVTLQGADAVGLTANGGGSITLGTDATTDVLGVSQALTLAAVGGGDVTVNGDVGAALGRLGAVTVSSAANATFGQTVTAASLLQTTGTGTTTFSGVQNYNTAAGLKVLTDTIALNQSVTTTGTGIVTLNANNLGGVGAGTLTIGSAGDITSDDVVSLTGASGISTAGDVTTTGDVVTYNSATTLTGGVLVDTTSANGSPAGATVTFSSFVAGNNNLTLSVGTDNSINLLDQFNDLATLSVLSGKNLGVVDRNSLSFGTVILSGSLTALSGNNLSQAAGTAISVDSSTSLTAGGGSNILLGQLNTFSTAISVAASSGVLSNVTLADTTPIDLAGLSISQNLSITASEITQSGSWAVPGVLTVSSSGGGITLARNNLIGTLGSAQSVAGNFQLINQQSLNMSGPVTINGNTVVTVAGQLVNQSGLSTPFAGTTGSTTLRMLSPFVGGSLSPLAGLSGFTVGYNAVNPGARNSIIYSVSPLTMFAPSGTVIAGVDLSGTQTGGGQLNTFLTGSDDLNWIISDFGKFNLPKVSSAGLEYTIYPKRVEPETRTLPDSTLSQLRKELGRPPTIDEINKREVSMRQSDRIRSGSILERSSLDSSEEPVENAKAATPSPIEGQIPQANQEPKKVVPTEDSSFELTPPMASSQVLPDGSFQPKADERAAVSELLVKERANAEVGLAIPVARSK